MKPNFIKSADGLLPVVIQDSKTNIVLMLGYMDVEAFEKTRSKTESHFIQDRKPVYGQKAKRVVIFWMLIRY